MLARIHDEMRDSLNHLDEVSRAKVICAYVDYQLHGTEPSKDDLLVYTAFKTKQFDLDIVIKDIKASIENGKKGGRKPKNFENSQKPKTNLNQPKPNLSESEQEQEQEHKEKEIDKSISKKKEEFEKFWKEFPHARKGKKADSYNHYIKQNSDEVMKQVWILKRKIRAGLQDGQYIPACERWIRDFTPLNDDVIKQDLERICKWHLNAGGDAKERYQELIKTFGEDMVKETCKEVNRSKIQLNFT